ncbi:MAG: FHA domain-containing protein [Planctomycetota bacterium]|nr:FHA domain-containing protein [Planctomycetota bacterium]
MPKLIVQDLERTSLVDLRPGESLVIGRSHDCDIPIASNRASRRHAEIAASPNGDGHLVRDLDSTNGTLLNGAPFPDEAPVRNGDVVDVGGTLITYRSEP